MPNYVYASILLLGLILCFFIYKFPKIQDKKMLVNRYKFFSRIYAKSNKVPILGRHIYNIYNRLYANNPEDILTLRYKAIFYFFISLTGFGVSLSVLWIIYVKDLYMSLVVLLISLFMRSAILDHLIGDDTKLLNAFIDFLGDVKHSYQLHGVVLTSILEATDKASPLMNLHGKKIYEGIVNQDSLETFYINTYNKHLKNFAGHAYLTKEYGDKRINDISLYLKNVNYIISEIKLELRKKEGIKYRLIYFTSLTVVPILFPNLMEAWMQSNFSVSNFFYNSIWGDLSKLLIVLISLSCYLTIRYLKKTSTSNSRIDTPSNWDKVLLRNKLIKKVVVFFEPSKKNKDYYKAHDLLQESASHYDFHGFYLRKSLCFFLGLILTMSFFVSFHKTNTTDILNNTSYRFFNLTTRLITMDGIVLDVHEIDRQILVNTIKNGSSKIDRDELLLTLQEQGIDLHDPQALEGIIAFADTLDKKLDTYYYNETIKWWELIVSIVIAFFVMDFPTWILWFKRYLRKADMEDEVFQFNTIILLLMHHKTVSVPVILEWMERFADIFFNPIRKCIINLHSGTTQSLRELKDHQGSTEEVDYIKSQSGTALQTLREDVKYKSFSRLVDNLLSADRIGVMQAFESLENERSFYADERKEATKRTIKSRGDLGEMVGLIPIYATVILHMVIPLLWAASLEFDKLYMTFK